MNTVDYIFDKDFKITNEEYDIFKAFYKQAANTPENKCSNAYLTRCVATIIGAYGDHWRVIGISKNALNFLNANEFKKPKNFIQRGHIIPRAASISLLFRNRDQFVSKSEFEKIYSTYDLTILMTSDENKSSSLIPDFYMFSEDALKMFKNRFIGFDYEEREINYLKDLFKNESKKLHSLSDVYPQYLKTHESLN